jgi:2-dehydropantoate 2-reductase
MRILILGAGATGGYFGGLLAKAGVDVTFLVRPKRREQLARDGLKIESPLGNFSTPVAAITQDELRGPFDVVILSAKAYGLAASIEAIRPAVGEATLVLPVLNGMKHLDDLDAAFGRKRVLGGTCHISVVLEDDGRIRHMSPFASLTQGARVPDQQESAARLHKELSRGGFEARHSDDVIGAMWEKWVLLATLAGSTCLMRASIAAVATASDHPPRSVALSIVRPTLTDPESQISASMLRDIQRGGQIEAEHIVGDLIRRGREHSVPTPLLEIAYVHLQAYQNRMKTAQVT